MLFVALAEGAGTFGDDGAEANSGVLEDGNASKQDAGEESNQKSEEQNGTIDADFTDARKSRRSDGGEDAKRGVSEAQSNDAAEQSEKDAFEQKIGSDAAAACAENGAHRELPTTAFHTDKQ